MKDTFYIKHDCNARQDENILALRMRHGWEGYGLYWAIIERLRESGNYECVKDYNVVAFDLRSSADKIKSVIEDFGLFSFTEDGKRFYSERLKRDMQVKDDLSQARREAGLKGLEKRYKSVGKVADEPEDVRKMLAKQDFAIASPGKRLANIIEENIKEDSIEKKESTKEKGETAQRFAPPTSEEVLAYALEKGYKIDAERFVDFYASKGWMVGRNKMKDWRAAVRNWHKSDQNSSSTQKQARRSDVNDEWV